jgi:hypothetical protein
MEPYIPEHMRQVYLHRINKKMRELEMYLNELKRNGDATAEPVEPPDDQGVALPDVVEGFVQPGALCLCSACGVGEDLGAAYLLQGVLLEIKSLVCG